jgi:ribosomal protein S18 acetylase RimI-like enzyme
MPLVIRSFELRDLAAVLSCIAALQDAERVLDPRVRPGHEIAHDYFAQLRARSAAQQGTMLVAETEGEVVGFAAVQARVPYQELDDPPGEYALLSDLVVVAAHRRRGIGQALLEAAEAYARAHNATELRIGVLAANGPARRLYRDLGFTPHFELFTKRLTGEGRRH